MTVESCLKKDDLLLDTINDAMQDVPAKPRSIEDDMAVSQVTNTIEDDMAVSQVTIEDDMAVSQVTCVRN